jgi:hypothetical protein
MSISRHTSGGDWARRRPPNAERPFDLVDRPWRGLGRHRRHKRIAATFVTVYPPLCLYHVPFGVGDAMVGFQIGVNLFKCGVMVLTTNGNANADATPIGPHVQTGIHVQASVATASIRADAPIHPRLCGHRLGQDKPVFVHRLVMLASIEEKIEVPKTRTRDLAAVSFNPDGSALELTGVDIDDLFALLLAELVVANLIARAMFYLGRVKKFAYFF